MRQGKGKLDATILSIDVSGSVGNLTGELKDAIEYEVVLTLAILEYCRRINGIVGLHV